MYSKIIHLHLAKTAGWSINRWLDLLTAAERASPAEYDQTFVARHHATGGADGLAAGDLDLHTELGREYRAYWDVIHSHSIGVVDAHPSAYRFVILREPTSRLLSFLRDWRRFSVGDVERITDPFLPLRRDARVLDASAFILAHAASPLLAAMSQTSVIRHAVGLALPATLRDAAGATDLDLARLALDELFDYVGIYEDLPGAVRCIARDVGAAPPAAVGRANVGRHDASRDVLSPEALAALRSTWRDDYALHEHATRLSHGFAEPAYDEAAFEHAHLATRLSQLAPRFLGWGRGFSVHDQIVGSGFLGRDPAGSPQAVAWTGPGTRTVLYVPVPADERVDLFLDVADVVDPRVRESLRLRVDDRDAGFVSRGAAAARERLWIRVATSRPFVKLEILVDRTFSTDELGRGAGDHQLRGIALRAYGFRVVPPAAAGPETWPGESATGGRGGDPLGDDGHPDHAWAVDLGRRFLTRITADRTEDEVLAVLTFGIGERELRSSPTQAGVAEAFRRTLRREPPQEWLDFWVGKRRLTLRRLYEDLVRGDEFRQLRERLS